MMSDALVAGEQVKISSFGTFSVSVQGRPRGPQPKTGEEVPIQPAPRPDLPALAPDERPRRRRQPGLIHVLPAACLAGDVVVRPVERA
jgi:hypothetical protein